MESRPIVFTGITRFVKLLSCFFLLLASVYAFGFVFWVSMPVSWKLHVMFDCALSGSDFEVALRVLPLFTRGIRSFACPSVFRVTIVGVLLGQWHRRPGIGTSVVQRFVVMP